MIVRIVKFVLGPDRQWEAERMADVIAAINRNQPGFQEFHFFADHDAGEYQTSSFWATKQDWDDSFKVVWPYYENLVGDHFQWGPTVQMYEVYEPRLIAIP